MKIFRFMSNEEFEKYINSEELINNTNHSEKTNGKSTGTGFCFLSLDEYTPEYALNFMTGIVNLDICAVFEVNRKLLKKEQGQYATPIAETGNAIQDLINLFTNFSEKFIATEYCTTHYNNKVFKLIKYTKNIVKQYQPLEEQKELIWEELK